jgi:mediator of RNA polymerase II transcription subunit 12
VLFSTHRTGTDVVLTELPHDTKVPIDPFRNYPEFVMSDIPADIALEHRRQILALATQLSPCASVSDLVTSSRDNHNDVIFGNPVINRPWEWTEYLGDPITDAKEENRNGDNTFKNAGAIPLEMFSAKITGDSVIPSMSDEVDGKMESRIRTFEDGLSADTLFRRDWRETRVLDASEASSGPPFGFHLPSNSEASEAGKEIAGGHTFKVTSGLSHYSSRL